MSHLECAYNSHDLLHLQRLQACWGPSGVLSAPDTCLPSTPAGVPAEMREHLPQVARTGRTTRAAWPRTTAAGRNHVPPLAACNAPAAVLHPASCRHTHLVCISGSLLTARHTGHTRVLGCAPSCQTPHTATQVIDGATSVNNHPHGLCFSVAPARHCNNCRTPCSDPLGCRIDPGLGGQLQPPVVDSTRNRNPTEPVDTWHYVLQQRATAVVCGTPPTELSTARLNTQLRHSCMPTRRLGSLLHAIMQMTRGLLNQTATWAEWRAGPQHKRNVNWQPPTPAHVLTTTANKENSQGAPQLPCSAAPAVLVPNQAVLRTAHARPGSACNTTRSGPRLLIPWAACTTHPGLTRATTRLFIVQTESKPPGFPSPHSPLRNAPTASEHNPCCL
jgi:hypothetical protein